MKNKLIIAHRGESNPATENTIEAFASAIESGADMIELDTRMSLDKIPVVFHDDKIAGSPVADLEFREIRERGLTHGIMIPTLDEVLQFTSGKIRLNVELKIKAYEREIAARVLKYYPQNQCVLSSFYFDSLVSLKKIDHRIQVGLILGENHPSKPIPTRFSEIFPHFHRLSPVLDYIIPHWKLFKFGILNRSRRHKLNVWVWTVNQPERILKYLYDPRISGIITDKAGLAVSLLKQMRED